MKKIILPHVLVCLGAPFSFQPELSEPHFKIQCQMALNSGCSTKGVYFYIRGLLDQSDCLEKKILIEHLSAPLNFIIFKAYPMHTIERPNFRSPKSASNHHITTESKHRSLPNSAGKHSLYFYMYSFIFETGNNNLT